MDLKTSDIVVIGAFNPAIISPEWLIDQGITTAPAEPTSIDLELGLRNDIVFTLDECRWRVSPDRLVLEPLSAANPVAKIKSVVEKLPHTPVRAVGLNFHFHCPAAAWKGGQPRLGSLAADSLTLGGKVQHRAWTTGVAFEDGSHLNLTVRTTDAQTLADFNFHRLATKTDKVLAALDKFDHDMIKARGIVAQLNSGETR
jgi:hypothetical protein